MTACAPNTYHRPQRPRTGASAERSSSAAGWTATAEQLREAHVKAEIVFAVRGIGPIWMLPARLTTKLVGDTPRLNGTETRDAFTPVRLFAFASGVPVSRYEFANTARDHAPIVR